MEKEIYLLLEGNEYLEDYLNNLIEPIKLFEFKNIIYQEILDYKYSCLIDISFLSFEIQMRIIQYFLDHGEKVYPLILEE